MESVSKDLFLQTAIEWLDRIEADLWNNLDTVPDRSEGKKILSHFVQNACQAQNVGVILVGRQAIHKMPQPWIRENLAQCAEEALNLSEPWEYRRLLELCDTLDSGLLKYFVEKGSDSRDEEIREASEEFRKVIF